MPRGEQIAKPTEREMRLAGRFFCGAIPSALTTSAAPIHHLPEAGTMFKRLLVLGPAALLGAACGIDRPPPYRRDRRFQRDSGVQRRQVLGGRRNGKLEQAGVR